MRHLRFDHRLLVGLIKAPADCNRWLVVSCLDRLKIKGTIGPLFLFEQDMTKILYHYENFDSPHSPYVLIDYFFKHRLYLNTIAELNDPFEYEFNLSDFRDSVKKMKLNYLIYYIILKKIRKN